MDVASHFGLPSPPPSDRRTYSGNLIGGNARVHLGDVHGDVHYHILPHESSSSEQFTRGLIRTGLIACDGLSKHIAATTQDLRAHVLQRRLGRLQHIFQLLSALLKHSDFDTSSSCRFILELVNDAKDNIRELGERLLNFEVSESTEQDLARPSLEGSESSLHCLLDSLTGDLSLAIQAAQFEQIHRLSQGPSGEYMRLVGLHEGRPGPRVLDHVVPDLDSYTSARSSGTAALSPIPVCICRARSDRFWWNSRVLQLWQRNLLLHEPSCPNFKAAHVIATSGAHILIPVGRDYFSVDIKLFEVGQPLSLVCRRRVSGDNATFESLNHRGNWHWKLYPVPLAFRLLRQTRICMADTFRTGGTFPKDILLDGSNLLHCAIRLVLYISAYHTGNDDKILYDEGLRLIQDLLSHGVPAIEQNDVGEFPSDLVLGWAQDIKSKSRRQKHMLFQQQLLSMLLRHAWPAIEASELSSVWNMTMLKDNLDLVTLLPITEIERAAVKQSKSELLRATVDMRRPDIVIGKNAYSAAAIACEADWVEGLQALVHGGLDLSSRLPHYMPSPLEEALRHSSPRCVEFLLREPYAISDPARCLELGLHGDSSRDHSDSASIVELFTKELASRRKRLHLLVLSEISLEHRSFQGEYNVHSVPDGPIVEEMVTSLETLSCLDVSPLSHHDYRSVWQCIGKLHFSVEAAELLWSAGFRGVPCLSECLDLTLRFSNVFFNSLDERLSYLMRQLSVCAWLRDHQNSDGTNLPCLPTLRWAERLGVLLARRPWESQSEVLRTSMLSSSTLRLLQDVFLVNHSDCDLCHCTVDGCSGLDRMIYLALCIMEVSVDRAVLYPSAKPSDIEVVKAALCYIGKVLAILLPSTMDCYEILSEKVIRAFLFAQIQLPHLCCNLDSTAIMNIESHAVNGNNVHYIDEESTQEDSEEHEEESARFEELLSDLLVRWRNDAGTMPLGEWVDIVLHPVTQAYLLTTDPRTTDYVKSVEALGVNVTTYTTTNPSKK